TDSYGEDGNFEAKVGVIERVSLLLPKILELQPKVLAITGDHSTPASYCAHSWHPVPLLLNGPFVRYSDQRFTEKDCARGDLGRLPSKSLMPLMVANAGRLKKFGA
ncbi:MAG: phosphoglycerate mutase, partial [Planctomycetota bacterium]